MANLVFRPRRRLPALRLPSQLCPRRVRRKRSVDCIFKADAGHGGGRRGHGHARAVNNELTSAGQRWEVNLPGALEAGRGAHRFGLPDDVFDVSADCECNVAGVGPGAVDC